MFFPFFDSTMIILIPAIILTIYAQVKISSTFNKYAKVKATSGYSGAQIARRLLDQKGLYNVQVELAQGRLTDHYDPRVKVVRLSEEIYYGTSLAALGVAAHETGHAVQHDEQYVPFTTRSAIVPVANFGSQIAPWLIMIGLFMGRGAGLLLDLGIIAFTAVVVFQLVTLPVEFNASSRALAFLENGGYLLRDEAKGARKVLRAAALTYVAAALTAILTLVRFLLIANAGDRRDD